MTGAGAARERILLALIGLHIWTQVCNWPPLGREISSILCSG